MKIIGMMVMVILGVGSIQAQQNLEVTIKKVHQKKGGTVRVALFNNSDSFLKKPVKVWEERVNDMEVKALFINLDEGEYAISVFHDTNDNRKLDTNIMGIPSEPYGFSNDVMGAFGPPSFERAKFKVEGGTRTVIHLR